MDNFMATDSCTLPTDERPIRLAEFDDLFASAVRSVDRDGTRVRVGLSGDSGLSDRVRDLTERESACCSFFTFTLDGDDSDLTLEITVPPEYLDILVALAERARGLSA
jgi:hypothetical protein